MRSASCAGVLLAALSLLSSSAVAEHRRIQSRAKLFDVAAMSRLASKGEVALIEANDDGSSRQVVIFALLNATPERVFDVIMDVESYPKFLNTVAAAKVTRRQGPMIAYAWELDVPFVTLSGVREQRGVRPKLVEARGVSGNFRGTTERWELYPVEDGKRTLAAFYRSIDVDTGGFLLKTMVKLEQSMEQGVTLATGFMHMRGLRRHVEGLPPEKHVARQGPVPPFRQLKFDPKDIDLAKLRGLIEYGQLALIESEKDGSLKQVALFTVVKSPRAKMVSIVQDPAKYPEFIPSFAEQRVQPAGDHRLRMEWELEVPLVNLEGVSMMTIEDNGSVDVVALEGDITRGRWRWDFLSLEDSVTVPVHYAYTDVRESSWVTRTLVDKQPLFEHGIVIASGTVALHAMKARAEGRR